MASGTLKITTTMAYDAIPVSGVSYAIKDKAGKVLYSGITNENGESEIFTLDAPSKAGTLQPNPNTYPYGVYDIWLGKPNYATINIIDVEVFDGIFSVQPVNMIPVAEGDEEEFTIVIPPPLCALPTPPQLQVNGEETPIRAPDSTARPSQQQGAQPFTQKSVIIPDFVTVHLGVPSNSSAPNTRVPFIDYVKNVTCSEIYPTWPNNSIIANVHCVVSFVLNRIYTEWYRVRGYNFDITNSTTVDQYFVPGRTIFANISQIVDGIFNIYARRSGFRNPYFTEFCNGTTTTCKGLSQWGTVTLANRGFTPIQILHNFYPNDLILTTAPQGTVVESYPGVTLQVGSTGESVRRMQNRLNRIRVNYPAIPIIANPNGVYGADTEAAVRAFQRTFNLLIDGKVGRNTWNRINQIWSSITKLSELDGEGERIGLDPNPPKVTIRQGSRGADVIHAQFILNYIAQFYPDIPAPIMDSVFGAGTTDAVRAFQRRFGLTADGIVGPNTWNKLYEVFRNLEGQTPPTTPETPAPPTTWPPFPGVLIRRGSTGANVRTVQEMLNNSRRQFPTVPAVSVDGIFGPLTENAVRAFQRARSLNADGIVGPITWNALAAIPRI